MGQYTFSFGLCEWKRNSGRSVDIQRMQSFSRVQSKTEMGGLKVLRVKLFLQSGRGALALAIISRQFEMTKKLVEMGFDVNQPCGEVFYFCVNVKTCSKGCLGRLHFIALGYFRRK